MSEKDKENIYKWSHNSLQAKPNKTIKRYDNDYV